jgi:BMFP domain-containing protein YqiC
MIKREKILGQIGKFGGKLFVSAAAMRKEVEALSTQKLEQLAKSLDLVRRSEFESVQAMVKEARATQVRLEKRINELEKMAAGKSVTASKGKSAGKKMPTSAKGKSVERKVRN